MKELHIVNPAAGKGKLSHDAAERLIASGADVRLTTCAGDGEKIIRESLADDPALHIFVYGGDGTLGEAVNGIMDAGAGETAALTVVPTGSGNDFARLITPDFDMRIDLMKYETDSLTRYAANTINIGFDCEVVRTMAKYRKKWFVRGSGAYYFSLADTLIRKPTVDTRLTLIMPDGSEEVTEDGRFLLFAIANGQYCGGGFRSNPLSAFDDGVLDIIIAKNISRVKFIRLVGDYKAGTHIDAATRKLKPSFEDTLRYVQCAELKLSGKRAVCADGEISDVDDVRVSVEKSALRVIGYKY